MTRATASVAIRERLRRTGDLPPAVALHDVAAPDPSGEDHPHRYDDTLRRAVRSFQQRRGLIADGIVGPQTYLELDGARWSLGDRLLSHTPGHLMQGDDVATLQERLLALGFSPERVDGLFGPNTEQAVRGFQRGVGLAPDGVVGPETLRAFADLSRSITGGSPHTLRERELVRRSGHSLSGRIVVLDPGHGGTVARGAGRLAARGRPHAGPRPADRGAPDRDRRDGAVHPLRLDAAPTTSSAPPSPTTPAPTSCCRCTATPTDQPQAGGVATFFFGQDRFGAWSAIGEQLADLVQREIVARTGLADCRSHPRAWTLLQRTRMPAVRIEAGYLTHAEDAALLAQPQFRDTLAEAVVVALQRTYLGEDDTNATGTLHLGDLRAYLASRTG